MFPLVFGVQTKILLYELYAKKRNFARTHPMGSLNALVNQMYMLIEYTYAVDETKFNEIMHV